MSSSLCTSCLADAGVAARHHALNLHSVYDQVLDLHIRYFFSVLRPTSTCACFLFLCQKVSDDFVGRGRLGIEKVMALAR